MDRIQAIYRSMTEGERVDPNLLRGQRLRRIALGAGVDTIEVDRFMRQFEQTRDIMNAVRRMGPR